MADFDDRDLALGRVYARAMLALAQSRGEADALAEEVGELAALLADNPDFAAFLASPLVDAETRAGALEKAFRGRASDLLVDSLQVINRKDRSGMLPAVLEAYRREHRDARGIVEVRVKSAAPLSAGQRERLREAARRYAGREVELVEAVDPELIGGLVLQVGDERVDASVASQLARLGDRLADRAAREIHSGKSYLSQGSETETGAAG